MKYFSHSLIVVGALSVFTGCNGKTKVDNANHPPRLNGRLLERKADTVARVTVAEAKQAVDSGEAVIVDVRTTADYGHQHIKGAISLPVGETGSRVKELPSDKLLITYCSCPAEQSSIAASQIYFNNGYQNTAAMVGGTQAWVAAGYPTNSGNQP